jgi:hypothetical protein
VALRLLDATKMFSILGSNEYRNIKYTHIPPDNSVGRGSANPKAASDHTALTYITIYWTLQGKKESIGVLEVPAVNNMGQRNFEGCWYKMLIAAIEVRLNI